MRYAILSDIHGNLEALKAVLKDIESGSIDRVVCLGDIVGYYPDPEQCVDLVRKHVSHCVAGNHDYAAIGRIDTQNFRYHAFMAMEWTKRNLSADTREFLESLPLSIDLDGMFFTHSSPSNPQEWVYVFPDSEDAIFQAFNCLVYQLNFIGHTHWPSIMIQHDDKVYLHADHTIKINNDHYYLLNVGSVGQPRDFDPRSSYGVYDSQTREFSLVRVKYDYSVTQKRIRDNDLPSFLADRLEKGN